MVDEGLHTHLIVNESIHSANFDNLGYSRLKCGEVLMALNATSTTKGAAPDNIPR